MQLKDRTNLPASITSFIGRQTELEEISQALEKTRLLTLSGVGGCGKTRLALEMAERWIDRFVDGVYWAELAPVMEPELVSESVARLFPLREMPDQTAAERIIRFIKKKQLLLVLDNCEQVIAACAELAQVLLEACPNLKILATSREPMSLIGESIWRVPPLSLPDFTDNQVPAAADFLHYDAVRFFVERATAVVPAFRLNNENAPVVLQICQRLDGIPLAIELAAARMSVLALEEILQRLDDRFSLLGTSRSSLTARHRMPRHQTLRAAIDWSYQLLAEPERNFFRCLAIFEGGFTVEALEAIFHPELEPAEVFDGLAGLVDKSLVVSETLEQGHARYHLLETIREYAREKLEVGELRQLQDRHLDYFCHLAEQAEEKLKSAEQLVWFKRLDAEQGNLRAAIHYSRDSGQIDKALGLVGSLSRYWDTRGYWSEGLQMLLGLLALDQAQEPASFSKEGRRMRRLKALYGAGMLTQRRRALEMAQEFYQQSLRLAREVEDPVWMALSLSGLGSIAIFDGTLAEKQPSLEESVAFARSTGDAWLLSLCLLYLGHCVRLRDNDAALPIFKESLDLARRTGDRILLSEALFVSTNAAYGRGDIREASEQAKELVEVSRQVGRKEYIALGLLLSAGAILSRERTPEGIRTVSAAYHFAEASIAEALTLAVEVDDRTVISLGLVALGFISVVSGHLQRAARLFGSRDPVLRTVHIQSEVWSGPGTSRRESYDYFIPLARSQLGEEAFEEAIRSGQSLSADQAIEEGLQLAAEILGQQKTIHSMEGHPPVDLLIQGLGPVQVEVNGLRLGSSDWGYSKAQELLFYLLCHPGRSREQIGADLWPEDSPAQLHNHLGVVLHALRRALGSPAWIAFREGRYTFLRSQPDRYSYDVEQFEQHLHAARTVRSVSRMEAIAQFQFACSLYRGAFLEGLQVGEWYIRFREAFQQAYLEGLVATGDLFLEEGRAADALAVYHQAVQLDPYLEVAHRGMMLCFSAQGERGQAVRHYRMLSEQMRDEMGSSPSAETAALFQQISRSD